MKIETSRYIIVFFITLAIFLLTFWISSFFGNKKLDQLRDIQSKIAVDILSTETRYALLGSTSCDHSGTSREVEFGLSEELNGLAKRLKFMESQLGSDNEEVVYVKEYYTLLQIKDYLLVKELNERCGQSLFTILYFHDSFCEDCVRQSLVLDQLVSDYPGTRVYWLDSTVETPAMDTLMSLFNVEESPTIVVYGETIKGFVGYGAMEELLPEELKSYQGDIDEEGIQIETQESNE